MTCARPEHLRACGNALRCNQSTSRHNIFRNDTLLFCTYSMAPSDGPFRLSPTHCTNTTRDPTGFYVLLHLPPHTTLLHPFPTSPKLTHTPLEPPLPHFNPRTMPKGGGGKGSGGGKGGGGGGRAGAGQGRGPGNAGGWPSTTGNGSGGGRSNNPPR